MSTRYPDTIHISSDMVGKIDQPVDPAVVSSRPGGGNTTQSYLKGDIIADQLNAVFGPLGWGVEAGIHQMDDWDETKSVRRDNQMKDVNMHMVQVVSAVKLTIKKTTPEGTDTIFIQPGIGYGEVEDGKSRKEAFGMAVKGAATDGLKRCATLVGKAFGMMMASNGSQDDIEYAHNGKRDNLRKAQEIRRKAARQLDDRQEHGDDRRDEHSPRGDSRGRDEGQRREGSGQQTQERRDEPQQREPQRQQRETARQQDEPQRQSGRQQEEQGGQQGRRSQSEERPQEQRQDDRQAKEAPKKDVEKVDAKPEAPKTGGKRQADTNYALDSVPITKQEMTDFGATLVERVKEMRQHTDRVGLVKQHLNTIKNLDSAIRRRVIDRLREVDVDVDKIPS